MTGDDARRAALDVIKFEFIDARETPEIGVILGVEVGDRLGPRDERPLSILAREASGAVVAGLNAVSHWRWLYVRHLYVAPSWRGQGLGRRLLAQGEEAARARGCVGVYLDTFEESAAVFYESRGFVRHGRIENFPPGAARIFLSKTL
ncbi:MAG: GNAT family N-acetyltransferase [Methylocystis sp.]|jgi:GNAT superfamily N-acetyltransferase